MSDFYKELEMVNRDWSNFEFVEDKTDIRLQTAAVKGDYKAVQYFPSVSQKILDVIESSCKEKYLPDRKDSYKKEACNILYYLYPYIKNTNIDFSKEFKISAAWVGDLESLNFIKNPSEEVKVAVIKKSLAFKKCHSLINTLSEDSLISIVNYLDKIKDFESFFKEIESPSEKVLLAAVKEYSYYIKYIQNPSEKVQLAAVNENANRIEYIQNPSEKVQLTAINNDPSCIEYIQNPSEKVQLVAVNKYPSCIEYIQNPSEKVQLAAVNKDPDCIRFIQNPSEKVQLATINVDPSCICYIEKPTEKVKLSAVSKDPLCLRYRSISNRSEELQMAAASSFVNSDSCSVTDFLECLCLSKPSDKIKLYLEDVIISDMQRNFFNIWKYRDLQDCFTDKALQVYDDCCCKLVREKGYRYIEDLTIKGSFVSEKVQLEALKDFMLKKGKDEVYTEKVFNNEYSKYFTPRVLYYKEHGCFPGVSNESLDFSDDIANTGFSLSASQLSLLNKILKNIRMFLSKRLVTGTVQLYERNDIIYLKTNVGAYAYKDGKIQIKSLPDSKYERETIIKLIEGTVELLVTKVPFSIKNLKFDVSKQDLSCGFIINSIEEEGSVDIILK